MKKTTLKQLKKGDFFTLKDRGDNPDEKHVFIRDEYERCSNKYLCYKFDDVNEFMYKHGTTIVYTDFIF